MNQETAEKRRRVIGGHTGLHPPDMAMDAEELRGESAEGETMDINYIFQVAETLEEDRSGCMPK